MQDFVNWLPWLDFYVCSNLQTFEVLDTFSFENDEFEQGSSITLVDQKDPDAPQLFAVGTAYVDPNVEEPTKGRILVFKVCGPRVIFYLFFFCSFSVCLAL